MLKRLWLKILLLLIIAGTIVLYRSTHLDQKVNSEYPGVDVYRNSLLASDNAVIIPPLGIFVSLDGKRALIDHEYGHYLQYLDMGLWRFYTKIALHSIYNKLENNLEKWKYGHIRYSVAHDFYATETDANARANAYFKKKPSIKYPVILKTKTPQYNWSQRLRLYLKSKQI